MQYIPSQMIYRMNELHPYIQGSFINMYSSHVNRGKELPRSPRIPWRESLQKTLEK